MKKKTVALLMSLVLIFGVAVGGTIAWLMDTTKEVVNTFTVGKVDIDLTETGSTLNTEKDVYEKSYKMIPGSKLSKDPTVKVYADSEACWLFIEVVKSGVLDTYISYGIAEGWIELEPGVYYREVADTDEDQTFAVLAGNEVTVNSSVTSELMEALGEKDAEQPTLSFKAYAIQKENTGDAAAAWTKINTPDA